MKILHPELAQAARTLGNALAQTKPLREYREATDRLVEDREATALLDELQCMQTDIRLRQNNGSVTAADLARLRDLQSRVKSHPTIAAFSEAQLQVQAYLPTVNRELSELLGVDFATLGRVSSCC